MCVYVGGRGQNLPIYNAEGNMGELLQIKGVMFPKLRSKRIGEKKE